MMRSLVITAVALAAWPAFLAGTASAGDVYIPPIVEATVTDVTSEDLGDGRWHVTIEASVVNTSDAPLEGVELLLVNAGGVAGEPASEPLVIGPMAVGEPLPVAWELETYAAPEAAEELRPDVAGSATDTFGDPMAVWVEFSEEATQ